MKERITDDSVLIQHCINKLDDELWIRNGVLDFNDAKDYETRLRLQEAKRKLRDATNALEQTVSSLEQALRRLEGLTP